MIYPTIPRYAIKQEIALVFEKLRIELPLTVFLKRCERAGGYNPFVALEAVQNYSISQFATGPRLQRSWDKSMRSMEKRIIKLPYETLVDIANASIQRSMRAYVGQKVVDAGRIRELVTIRLGE